MKKPYTMNEQVQAALEDFIRGLRVLEKYSACYLTGSYYGGYAVEGASDIDLTLISDGVMSKSNKAELQELINQINHTYSIDLDVSVIAQRNTSPDTNLMFLGISFREAALSAKLAGGLIWGEDVLSQLSMPSNKEYVENTKRIPFEFSNRIRNYTGLTFPLVYPNSGDKYFGYPKSDNGVISTKQLISLMTWIGTATVANLSDIKVGNKKQCIDALKQIDFEMGEELVHTFDLCRRQWNYKEPQTPEEQKELRKICGRALDWENQYYNRFFAKELKMTG